MDKVEFKYYAKLATQAKAGDEEAFLEIYQRTKPAQICHLRGILGTTEEIQDALQEVYALLYQNLDKINPPTVLIAYLNRLTYYVGKNMARKQSRRNRTFSSMESMDEIEGEHLQEELYSLEKREVYGLVRRAVDELPAEQRSVVIMRYYQRLKYEDVAMSMGITQSKAKRLMSSAQENLRKALRRQGIQEWEVLIPPALGLEVTRNVEPGGESVTELPAGNGPLAGVKSGIFQAVAESTLLSAGTAVLGLAVCIVGGAAFVAGPKISDVRPQSRPTNHAARVEVSVDSTLPIQSISLKDDSGRVYEGRRGYDNVYFVEAPENGGYRVIVENNRGRSAEADCQVDCIDREQPRVADILTEGELTQIIFEEDASGIDLDSIYCLGEDGERTKPSSVDGDGHSAYFYLPESDQTLYFRDRAGNTSKLPLMFRE